ncbi:hypothetical protein RHGRI_003527 [Rhododendron griersonianum]|uniref:Uncharacterized protein n=1 Tax=Rhododendron griersonianum TaxID=479676 RepID=A0AAV6L7P3_9ERIC|nr:hypothetical protein RHGRI_003527 [Rhododendron griersonianum]
MATKRFVSRVEAREFLAAARGSCTMIILLYVSSSLACVHCFDDCDSVISHFHPNWFASSVKRGLREKKVATEHDAAKIVNNSALFLGNAGILFASISGMWVYLRNKKEASLEQRKVIALEVIAQAKAKEAGLELPNPGGEKKSVALADTIGVKSPFQRWGWLAGNMDGVLLVASKAVAEYAISA